MTPAEILDKAADYIEEHGWVRDTYQTRTGEVCVLGAIGLVCSGGQRLIAWDDQATRALRDFIDLPHPSSLSAWNDKQVDGVAVITALRQAAERSRSLV